MVEPLDPALHPPEWYALAVPPHMFFHPLVDERDGYATIYLGEINGYRVVIWHYVQGDTHINWGCRSFLSETEAREHFMEGDISITSGEHRPHATRLIDWVRDICLHRGWAW